MFTWLCCLCLPVCSVLWSVGKAELAKQRVLICWCSSWQFLGRWVICVQQDVFIDMPFLLLFIRSFRITKKKEKKKQFKITENQIKPNVNMRKLVNWYKGMISCSNAQMSNLKVLGQQDRKVALLKCATQLSKMHHYSTFNLWSVFFRLQLMPVMIPNFNSSWICIYL